MSETCDFFVAGRYRNNKEVLRLNSSIQNAGYSTYCFLESRASTEHLGPADGDGEAAMKIFEARDDWRNDPAVREVFESDMKAEREANTFVLLLPAGKSCHIEAGVAYGLGKKLVVIGEQKETESLYLIFDEMYPTIEDFINSLNV